MRAIQLPRLSHVLLFTVVVVLLLLQHGCAGIRPAQGPRPGVIVHADPQPAQPEPPAPPAPEPTPPPVVIEPEPAPAVPVDPTPDPAPPVPGDPIPAPAAPGDPPSVPEPAPQPVLTPGPAPAATRAEMLNVRGNFCDLIDARGRAICTPKLPGADAATYDDWMTRLREAGGTHITLGMFTGGPWYTPDLDVWDNPDLESNPTAFRAFIQRILDTPSASGKGWVPILFLDGGGRDPKPRIDRIWPRLAQALSGLRDRVIVVPAYEPVVGDWRSGEVSYALEAAHRLFPESVLAYHGSPQRLVGSSHCDARRDRDCTSHDQAAFDAGDPKGDYGYESDDPWQGGEAEFYKEHGGQYIDLPLYQTDHGRGIYGAETFCDPGPILDQKTDAQERCWRNRWADYVYRLGAGQRGWRKVPQLVLFETTVYEAFRKQANPEDARRIADAALETCKQYGAVCGFANGLPH